jgi:DNA repair protein RecN (Recombination protein N)
MLAIRVVLADRSADVGGPGTLVFDEVDAGVGGEAGLAIGRSLAALAGDRQVLCVTHLAQVAAAGTAQLVVTKRELEGRTVGSVELVLDDARLSELARMLGGTDSDSARRHAQELLDGAPARSAS